MGQQVGAFILELIAYAGGSTALAFIVFKTLGDRWLESKFKERLKLVEHGYAVELSKFKQRLDTAANGLNRIHQKEFEVLPEAWGLLDEAINTLKWVVSPMQSYSDVSRLGDEDWRDFIEGADAFGKADKRYLLGIHGTNRQKEYNRLYDAHKNWLAEKAIRDFQNYAARHSIFLPEDLRVQFDAIRDVLWSASVSKSVGREAGTGRCSVKDGRNLKNKQSHCSRKFARASKSASLSRRNSTSMG